jgi:hypothetical protein
MSEVHVCGWSAPLAKLNAKVSPETLFFFCYVDQSMAVTFTFFHGFQRDVKSCMLVLSSFTRPIFHGSLWTPISWWPWKRQYRSSIDDGCQARSWGSPRTLLWHLPLPRVSLPFLLSAFCCIVGLGWDNQRWSSCSTKAQYHKELQKFNNVISVRQDSAEHIDRGSCITHAFRIVNDNHHVAGKDMCVGV